MRNHCSIHSSPCVVYPFQEGMMRHPSPTPRNHDLGASQGHFFMMALKKEGFTFLFSILLVMHSEILHAFVTIPDP